MPRLFFADNTVLVNFAMINRMDLLEGILSGNGRWCATIAGECYQSSLVDGLESISDARDFFGSPIYPNQAELVDTQVLRLQLAKPGDHRQAHLGESETLAVITGRYEGSFFVTDDQSAQRLAQAHSVQAVSTWQLFRLIYKRGDVTCAEALDYFSILKDRGAPRYSTCSDLSRWAG